MWVDLDFNSPMSDERAAQLVASLPLAGARVVDVGCGWAELLLRMLAADQTATGEGVDSDPAAIARARDLAGDRGLSDRVRLQVGDAAAWTGAPADVLLCIGSSHAWGGASAALSALRSLLRPGGQLVLGEAVWTRPPPPEALRALAATADEYGSVAELVDTAVGSGYRPLAVAEASAQEWDSFESRFAAAWERWLLANPDVPGADEVRARADQHRAGWLHGYRGVLGFAFLRLGVSR